MAGFIVCRAPVDEIRDERLVAIYRSESTPRLLALRRALETEATSSSPDVRRWCERRLRLLRGVLDERAPHPPL